MHIEAQEMAKIVRGKKILSPRFLLGARQVRRHRVPAIHNRSPA